MNGLCVSVYTVTYFGTVTIIIPDTFIITAIKSLNDKFSKCYRKDLNLLKKSVISFVQASTVDCVRCLIRKESKIGLHHPEPKYGIVVTGNRTGFCTRVILKVVPMFEMWSSVTSKLEVSHQQQQPHTSSGSIKGAFYFHNLKLYLSFLTGT